jgi:DNA-binding SARP family transcriptional activator
MRFRLLGPIEVVDGDRAVGIGGRRQRALLAALLLQPNQPASTDRLIDDLWGERRPDTAATALHGLVSSLRKALEPNRDSDAAPTILVTRAPGYMLRIDEADIDAVEFERLFETGRQALAADDAAEAADVLRGALALWHGPALGEIAELEFARVEAHRLEELRLQALDKRIEADLLLGHSIELVPELEALVREQPLRERVRGQLMLALYRCGRQAEALEVYRSGRRLLDEELGLQPDDELQRLERAILNHDPSLEPPVVSGIRRPSLAQRRRVSSPTQPMVPPDSVAVIDPQRSRVLGHALVGRRPVALAVGHGSVWVANTDDGTVSRIHPGRCEVMRTIGVGAPAIDLAVATDAVWVANGSDGTVSRIDPSADAVVETIDLRGSSELAWNPAYAVDADDDSVWIGSGTHHVLRIDPATNEPSAIIDVGHVPIGVALGEEALWVVTIAERALRIEPHTNTATAEVAIGYPVALTAGKQGVWVSDSFGQVWRINPHTGTVTQTTPVGRGLVGLCATEGAVFAANNADGTVVQVDPHDGRVVGLTPVGHAPTDVACWDGTVWVSIQSESAM